MREGAVIDARLRELAIMTVALAMGATYERYAREATLSLKVSDETWSALGEHFSVRETMDVVMAVAWYNAVARMLIPMEIETEDGFERD
jgi:hypothetical protein